MLSVVFGWLGNGLRHYRIDGRIELRIESGGGRVSGVGLFKPVTTIILSGSRIDDDQLAEIELEHCKHLRVLWAGYVVNDRDNTRVYADAPAPITDVGLAALPAFPELQTLHLTNATIGDAGLREIATKYPNLQALHLSGTKTTNESLPQIGMLDKLRFLDLSNTAISGEGLMHLSNLAELKYLFLDNTSVDDAGLKHLSGLRMLDSLDLRRTRVTHDGVAALRRATPELSLVFFESE